MASQQQGSRGGKTGKSHLGMTVKRSYNKQKGEKEPWMVIVTEYAGRKPTSWIRGGDQKRKCAKALRCKKMPLSKKKKFITV